MRSKNFVSLGFYLVALLFFSTLSVSAAEKTDKKGTPAPKVMKQGEDIETVLNTLNETLNENRALKQKLEAAQKEMKTIMAEGNTLKGQLRTYERDKKRGDERQTAMLDQTTSELAKRNQEMNNLKAQMDVIQKELAELQKKNEEAQQEKNRLQEILKKSVIEGEREEYLKLISEAEKSNESALGKVMASDREKEILKTSLADSEFKLGNEAFRRRDFEAAVVHYMKTLENRPSDAYANHNLGIIFDYYLLDKDRAIHYYRNYLDLKPVTEEANEIRERILELRLGKALIPPKPLETDYYRYKHYTS